jgi:hypothetical protein
MSYRVQIPKGQWTPFRNEVFKEQLGSLEEKRAAALYLFLYDRAYHRPSKAVAATVRQLSRLLKMDERVVKKCLAELRRKELIRKIRSGVRRSRINKDVWKVPLAEVDLKQDSWTPIPRVLIQKYLPADPNTVLLPLLLYYQHMNWLNYSWVGVTTLSKRLNWSASRVRDSLRSMFDLDAWYSRSELQWPLRCIALFVGAAQTGPHTVNANEFVLQDDQGRTRAKLSIDSKKVALVFFDETGLQQLSLTSMKDNSGHGHASLALGERAVSSYLVLAGSDPNEWATISDGGVFLSGKGTGSIVISNSGPTSPSVSIMDSQGYSTELGVTQTTNPATGTVQKSSAASIGLVGKDHKVLWSAPTDEKEK